MTLVSDIIRDGYRESNLIAIGTEPTGPQSEEALSLLSRILSGVYGFKEGEELSDLPIGRNGITKPSGFPYYAVTPDVTDFYVPPDTRLVLNITAPLTVYLNPMPDDGERFGVLDKSGNLGTHPLTVTANGRTIGGEVSVVINEDDANVEYMYRADLGDWTLVSPITTADAWPFPVAFDDMFVILLAARLNPRYDVGINPQSTAVLQDAMNRFKSKYRRHQKIGSELGLVMTPGAGTRYYNYSDPNSFNSGYPYSYWKP